MYIFAPFRSSTRSPLVPPNTFHQEGFFFRPLLNRRTAPCWHVSLALRGSANTNRARKNTTGCHAGGAKHGARGLVPTCATYVLAHALLIGGVTTPCLPLLRDDTARWFSTLFSTLSFSKRLTMTWAETTVARDFSWTSLPVPICACQVTDASVSSSYLYVQSTGVCVVPLEFRVNMF